MINSNEIIINKVKNWLKSEGQSYNWLANQIGVSKALMGHILSGRRQFLPERIVQVSKVMGTTPEKLMEPEVNQIEGKPYILQLRGKADSRVAKRHIKNMLFAIEDNLLIKKVDGISKGEVNDGINE